MFKKIFLTAIFMSFLLFSLVYPSLLAQAQPNSYEQDSSISKAVNNFFSIVKEMYGNKSIEATENLLSVISKDAVLTDEKGSVTGEGLLSLISERIGDPVSRSLGGFVITNIDSNSLSASANIAFVVTKVLNDSTIKKKEITGIVRLKNEDGDWKISALEMRGKSILDSAQKSE